MCQHVSVTVGLHPLQLLTELARFEELQRQLAAPPSATCAPRAALRRTRSAPLLSVAPCIAAPPGGEQDPFAVATALEAARSALSTDGGAFALAAPLSRMLRDNAAVAEAAAAAAQSAAVMQPLPARPRMSSAPE
jgi:hypothetical protein